MLKKTLAILCALVLCLGVFAGCDGGTSSTPSAGGDSAPADSGTESASTPESTETGGETTDGGDRQNLVVWGSWSGANMEHFETFLEKFNESQTEYTATYVLQQEMEKKLLTALAGGDLPDALIWDRFQTLLYAPKGALESFDDLISGDDIDLSIFYEDSVKEMTYDGSVYGLPFVVDNRALFYNKDVFREVGLDPEKPPETWDELREMAKQMTVWNGDTLERAGFALNDVGLYNTWILQAGGQMISDDMQTTAFNSPEGLAVLEFWDTLLNEDKVYALGFAEKAAEGEDPFIGGNIAMKWDGPWAIENLAKYAEDLDYGVAALPAGPDGERGAIMGGFGIAIAKGAKNVDGAFALAKWLTVDVDNNKELAKITGNIPANIEASEDPIFTDDPHFGGIVDNMQYASIRVPVLGYSQVEGDATIPNLQLFMSGELTAEQALAEAQTIGDQVLADNRS